MQTVVIFHKTILCDYKNRVIYLISQHLSKAV